MRIEYEIIKPDAGSSFRLLYQNKKAEDFIWQYHYHVEFEIVCVLAGSGTRHVGNHLSTYQDGDLVFIGSNIPHSGFGLNCSNPHEEIVIQVSPDVMHHWVSNLEEMKQVSILLERSKQGIVFKNNTKNKVTYKLKALLKLPPFERYINLLAILQEMAISEEYDLLNPQAIFPNSIKKHKLRLQKIFTFVEQNYQQNIEISEVAGLLNISVPSFCNYFKKATHTTFTEFVNNFRIQKACLLLLQDKTIAESCYDCGFNNITYFNKIFKETLGKTPSQFRKDN
jgi:AraC-like DNA-binding protein